MFTHFYIMPALALHIESQISFVQSIPVCLTKRRSNLVGFMELPNPVLESSHIASAPR